MTEALVAGHICLDIIPELPAGVEFVPGRLVESGPVTLCTGGAVANTGVALTRLGIEARLLGKVGRDPFGRIVRDLLDGFRPGLGDALTIDPEGNTSYTIVLNPPERDRTFIHDSGCNATFRSSDVSDEELASCRVMHFGYPTIMPRMFRAGGRELIDLFRRAKQARTFTSLDLTVPDAKAESGRVDWKTILSGVLPFVDLFLPNVEELAFIYEGRTPEQIPPAGDPMYARLAAEAAAMGAKFAGVKAGDQGFYLRVAPGAGLGAEWAPGEFWSPAFDVVVQGTRGAGDATVAGFLMGILRGLSPEETLLAAASAGACCCERPDAASGVRSWEETRARIASGWPRRSIAMPAPWTPGPDGIFSLR